MKDRIVITGCGWVTPQGAGRIADIAPLCKEQATGSLLLIEDSALRTDVSNECRRDRLAWISGTAVAIAVDEAGLSSEMWEAERVGLALGCALAGQLGMIDFAEDVREKSARFVSPIRFPQTVGNYASGALARSFAVNGPATTLACGTAGGLAAVIEGKRWMESGLTDVVLAGGCETVTPELATALAADGPVAEGGCVFVLERQSEAHSRKAPILGAFLEETDAEGNIETFVTSTAGFRREGAIFMEAGTGRAPAASGAAAIAGAVAAARGYAVPMIDATGRLVVQSIAQNRNENCIVDVLVGDGEPTLHCRIVVPDHGA